MSNILNLPMKYKIIFMSNIFLNLKKLISIAMERKRTTLLTLSPKQQKTKAKQLNNANHLHLKKKKLKKYVLKFTKSQIKYTHHTDTLDLIMLSHKNKMLIVYIGFFNQF